ncbi:oligoendopeptidase F [Anoxybacter fermentans]|uniref:Oligopeptidase F n=1 Tax=Anoxybacter fermentans TaxID=1323375 RepID=A0A3Q9HNM2_9FIRM|nr:oligoendopeptidase F [Anoxybacter fermentans]
MIKDKEKKLVQRHEIPEEYRWKTEDIYPDVDTWEADFQKVKERIPKFEKFRGHLGESAEKLLDCLKFRDETGEIAQRLFGYASRKRDEDTRISKYQSLYNRSFSLLTELQSATSFIVPEILTIPEEKLKEFMQTNSELAIYCHYIDNITRVREHVLSPELEKVLAMTSELANAPSQIFTMIDDADIKYPCVKDEDGNEVELTKGRFLKFMQSKDRRLRKDAFEAFYSSYDKLKNTIATTLASSIKADIFNARVRKYNSTLEAALDEDNIPVSVYHNLIKTVSNNLEPMYKYVRLRKKLLGVDELHMYDLYVSLIKDIDIEIPYEEAKKKVIEGLAPLGKEYQDLLKMGLESRWVDVYENEGKASGAYSAGIYGVHPIVLLNYNDTLDSMFTLAHEMGHAIHSYLSNEAQPFVYHRYTIFLAEVASTLNEVLLMDHLLKTTEEKEVKLAILNHFLEQFRGTVYRQTMFAEFEQIIHQKSEEGEVLTHEVLGKLYHELNEKYYGPDMVVDPQIDLEWARIPHFYSNFYVYKYATGFAAATSLARQIIEEGQPAVKRYIEFLRAGNSDYPINILKKAGVDMTTPEPIEQALQTFRELVDEMERLTSE